MPTKQSKRDLEHCNKSGSFGEANNKPDNFLPKGTGSSSSGSIEEDYAIQLCCFPGSCPFGKDALSKESEMVKVLCSYEECPMSQYMHKDCFRYWEEGLLNHIRLQGRARNWSDKQRRQNLWTKKGYDLAFRACMCMCKHGYLRKDLDWIPQATSPYSYQDATPGKKKSRKKSKDLPSLGNLNGFATKTKSRPIPRRDGRNRHCSTSSAVSVDQGYLSSSPSSETGPCIFSPPSSHRPHFSSHSYHLMHPHHATSHAPSTSPLLEEVPDVDTSSPQFAFSPVTAAGSLSSSVGLFSPPFSPNTSVQNACRNAPNNPEAEKRSCLFRKPTGQDQEYDIQAMSVLIENLWQHGTTEVQSVPQTHSQQTYSVAQPQNFPSEEQLSAQDPLCEETSRQPCPGSSQASLVRHEVCIAQQLPFTSPAFTENRMGQFRQENPTRNGWSTHDQSHVNSNTQVLLALQQKEKQEAAMLNYNNRVPSMTLNGENAAQSFPIPDDNAGHRNHTEVRIVPMRCTNFTKRYDFSLFENVVPRQHINPYHIKMEGEGYGSDDLRNLILASLSKAQCSKMNCVMCGTGLPIYDHFPLIDGTMFLSPEQNKNSGTNPFKKSAFRCHYGVRHAKSQNIDKAVLLKIKVEGKHEFLHAACLRCMEGLQMIVCRWCNTRWNGVCCQLGTLYMYDIFAANPCCQQRLNCKRCGTPVVDIRRGLSYFSDYSSEQTCPYCQSVDHHFVHPVATYQLTGLVSV